MNMNHSFLIIMLVIIFPKLRAMDDDDNLFSPEDMLASSPDTQEESLNHLNKILDCDLDYYLANNPQGTSSDTIPNRFLAHNLHENYNKEDLTSGSAATEYVLIVNSDTNPIQPKATRSKKDLITFFTCSTHESCRFISEYSGSLKTHQQSHDPGKWRECGRDGCTFSTPYAKSLTRHIAAIHEKIRSYQCGIGKCTAAASTLENLKRHQEAMHYKQLPYQCDQFACPFTAKTFVELKNHYKDKHCAVLSGAAAAYKRNLKSGHLI